MRFEEQVAILCAEALATQDEARVKEILAELRGVLHQHIDELRTGLRAAYPVVPSQPADEAALTALSPPLGFEPVSDIPGSRARRVKARRTWQRVVREIASATDGKKALQLGLELTRLLRGYTDSKPGT